MVNRKSVTKEQAFTAINTGEFGEDILTSSQKVVVIMTQDWCPQWHSINSWVYSLETDENLDVYELIYNKTDYYNEFMSFKENVWGNHSIPYLRFYVEGKLVKSTNYISRKEFETILGDASQKREI